MDTARERFPVELVEHSAEWALRAQLESQRVAAALAECCIVVHHIGSTSIPGIRAKPTIDLMPIVTTLVSLDKREKQICALGYEWRGEFGIEGRRFLTLMSAEPRKRLFNVHCFDATSNQAERHLAFRDFMRAHPERAKAYEVEKLRAQAVHPDDALAYSEEKGAWIKAAECEAVAWYWNR